MDAPHERLALMCGIAGIFDMQARREIDRDALHAMTDALVHRGPDGEGFYLEPGVGLGHRRLAIIDKEGGAQPFRAQTNNAILSYNGEIYNYRELAKPLSNSVALETRCDTEIVAEGIALHGTRFLHDLRGMFAFAHWNPQTRELLLARDRLGERPLYYAQTPDGFLVFASEITAIKTSGLVDCSINPQSFADYCYYGYVPDPKSIYRDIYKLPPGHLARVTSGGALQVEQYWRPPFVKGTNASFDDAADRLGELIDEITASQMMSDVPLGAFLSGGVDSSGVVAAMAQQSTDLVTCSIGFNEQSHDETAFAREMSQKFSTRHFEHAAKADTPELIDDVARAFGEPFADSSALPSFEVARLARQHVTVALSGDGGDEVFAGYRRYMFHLGEEKLRRLAPEAIRKLVFGPAGALYPKLDWAPQPLRFKSTLQSLGHSSAQGYAAAVAINFPDRAREMMHPDLKRSLGDYHPHSVIKSAMAGADTDDPLALALYTDLTTWLPGRMLVKVDRASMANSLEVRPPLLDHKLVEWAGALPSSFKHDGKTGKRVLKRAFENRLGKDFLDRSKQGFALPLTEWLRRENGPLLRLNTSKHWRESGYFDESAVTKMVRDHQRGARNCAQELWTIIMFDAFLRAHH